MKPQLKCLVCVSGPPRSGKDTVALYLKEQYGMAHLSLAAELKRRTAAMFGRSWTDASCWLEQHKDMPGTCEGMSFREALIWASEEIFKPKFGRDYWVRCLEHELDVYSQYGIVISDMGFFEEVKAMREYFADEQLHGLIMVQVTRPGTDFSNDSRRHIITSNTPNFKLANDSTIEVFQHDIKTVVGPAVEKALGPTSVIEAEQ